MARPSLPRWANVGGDIVEPSSGKKDVGWVAEERPPAQFSNWLLNLIYQWIVWLDAGYFTRDDPNDNTPVFAFTDGDGRERNYVDPNGYFFGPAVQECYRWKTLAIGASQTDIEVVGDLNGRTGATSAIDSIQPYDYGLNSVSLRLWIDSGTADSTVGLYRHTSTSRFARLPDLVSVMEFRMRLNTVGASKVGVWMGFHEIPGGVLAAAAFEDGTTYSYTMFGKKSGDTNWQCRVADTGAETSVDTGVPPVANDWQTFRVEYHGSNTPVGVENSSATARFFIDGVEVADIHDVNVPSLSPTHLMDFTIRIRSDNPGPGADFLALLSPVRFAYNEVLSPHVPA